MLHRFPHCLNKNILFQSTKFNLTVKHEGLRLCFIYIEQGSESNSAILENNPDFWTPGHQECKKHVWQAGTFQSLATCNPQQDAKWRELDQHSHSNKLTPDLFLQSSAFCPNGQRDRYVILPYCESGCTCSASGVLSNTSRENRGRVSIPQNGTRGFPVSKKCGLRQQGLSHPAATGSLNDRMAAQKADLWYLSASLSDLNKAHDQGL